MSTWLIVLLAYLAVGIIGIFIASVIGARKEPPRYRDPWDSWLG